MSTLSLRLPESLHKRVRDLARQDGISINQFISTAVAEKLAALMSDSLASFAALFRAVLLLHGMEAPVAKPDCVRATVRLLELDDQPFERIFAMRANGELPATEQEANDIFAAYMLQLERVVEAVDETNIEEPPLH